MVDIEAKKAQGKGIGYEHWAKTFNLKQAAQAVNIYTEYGFSSPEELDAAVSAAFAEMQASADKLKPIETALKEKKELRRQMSIYWATKPVREGLAAQKTKKAQAAYRQEHEADLLRSEAAVHFFKANGITKFPPKKKLTEEIEALLSEKNAVYSEYQEKKRWANELLTVKTPQAWTFRKLKALRRKGFQTPLRGGLILSLIHSHVTDKMSATWIAICKPQL